MAQKEKGKVTSVMSADAMAVTVDLPTRAVARLIEARADLVRAPVRRLGERPASRRRC